MTVSLDARTPSADLHTLTGSTPPGASVTVQPFGVAATPAANAADSFVPLGGAALDVVAGLAERRAAPLDPADARLIELAAAAEALERACDAHTAAHHGEDTDASDAAFGALASGFSPIEEEIAETPATTMLGVLAKARAAQLPTARAFDDCPFALSIADDLWRLSGKGATVPAVPALSDAGGDADLFAALAQLDEARTVHDGAARAFDAAVKDTPEHDGAGQRCDTACDALIDLEARVHDTPARTLAGLRAKAAVELVVAERAELDQITIDFLREVVRFVPLAPPQANLRPAPLPTGIPAGRYLSGTTREQVETYRTFLDMELRYLNWEVYGQTERRLHYWVDNPAAELHGPSAPAASTRAAAVLGLLGIMPTPGVDGRAQAEGLARAATASAA